MKSKRRARQVKNGCKNWINGLWVTQLEKDFNIENGPALPEIKNLQTPVSKKEIAKKLNDIINEEESIPNDNSVNLFTEYYSLFTETASLYLQTFTSILSKGMATKRINNMQSQLIQNKFYSTKSFPEAYRAIKEMPGASKKLEKMTVMEQENIDNQFKNILNKLFVK